MYIYIYICIYIYMWIIKRIGLKIDSCVTPNSYNMSPERILLHESLCKKNVNVNILHYIAPCA